MKSNRLFLRTFVYSLMKFGTVLLALILSFGLFLLMYYIPSGINEVIGNIGFAIWVLLNPLIYSWIKSIFGYSVRAGHLAAAFDMVTGDTPPVNLLREERQSVSAVFPVRGLFINSELILTKIIKQLNFSYYSHKGISSKLMERYVKNIAACAICYLFKDLGCDLMESMKYSVLVFSKNRDEIYGKIGKHHIFSFIVFLIVALVVCGAAFVIALFLSGYNFIITLSATILSIYLVLAVKYAFIDPVQFLRLVPVYIEKPLPDDIDACLEETMNISDSFVQLVSKNSGNSQEENIK